VVTLRPAAQSEGRRLLALFATLLEYPRDRAGLLEALRAGEALAPRRAREELARFRSFVEAVSPGRLEEVYAGTFDWDTALSLHVGYHLFGESYKRSAFLLGLKERYSAHGFPLEGELPDHLPIMLRFLALCQDETLAQELIAEAILPALMRILRAEGAGHPYLSLLRALLIVLGERIGGREGA